MLLAGCAVAVTLLAGRATQAAGPTCSVDAGGGGDYTTIGAAVADVGCTTINVAAGTYTEQVLITRSLTLHGAGAGASFIHLPAAPALDGDSQASIVKIAGGGVNVEVSRFTINGPLSGPLSCAIAKNGIYVRDGAHANIHDNTISDIRDDPLSGCQNGLGIRVGRMLLATTGTATITNNIIVAYQKGGIVVDNTGSNATITGNTVTGVGATPAIAQNGIQVSRGAVATVSGNTVSGNLCDHPTCGPDPLTQDGSVGILLFQAGAGTNVSNNPSVSNNDIGIYNLADATTISGNQISSNRYDGIFLDQGSATVTANRISGGNLGVIAASFLGNASNSAGSLSCNRIIGAGSGIKLLDGNTGDGVIPTVVANFNVIAGNAAGVVNTTSTSVNAEHNYWGCGTGANTAGCDTASANVDFTPSLSLEPACAGCVSAAGCSCISAADCDDRQVCNGSETCDTATSLCVAGTPLPDTDGDGLCNVTDNCPTEFNPVQSDGDVNGIGDLCDSFTVVTPMSLTHVCMTANRIAATPGNARGRILIRGVFDPSEVGDLPQALRAGGATIGVAGAGLPSTEVMTFPVPRCLSFGARTRCVGTRAEVLTVRPRRNTSLYELRISAGGRGFARPLTGSAVQVTIAVGGLDRLGTASCRALSGGAAVRCP